MNYDGNRFKGGEATPAELQGPHPKTSTVKGRPTNGKHRETLKKLGERAGGCNTTLAAPPPGLEPSRGSPWLLERLLQGFSMPFEGI